MTTILPEADELEALQPSATTLRLAGDGRLMAGAAYALMLQVAHPVVSAGVAEHSNFQEDPWGRLIRTLDYVNVTVFGGPEAASTMGRRTREMHKRIKGTLPTGEPYHSLEPEPFAWVHATLVHSIFRVQETFATRPSRAECEEFYTDWRRLGRHIGVREQDLPATFDEFGPYVERMERDVLQDTESVQTVLRTMMAPKRPPVRAINDTTWRALRWPAARTGRLVTAGLLGPRMRGKLGLPWSRAQQVQFNFIAAAHRAAGPVMPARAKQFGPTYLRWRGDALRAQGIPL